MEVRKRRKRENVKRTIARSVVHRITAVQDRFFYPAQASKTSSRANPSSARYSNEVVHVRLNSLPGNQIVAFSLSDRVIEEAHLDKTLFSYLSEFAFIFHHLCRVFRSCLCFNPLARYKGTYTIPRSTGSVCRLFDESQTRVKDEQGINLKRRTFSRGRDKFRSAVRPGTVD